MSANAWLATFLLSIAGHVLLWVSIMQGAFE